QGGCRWRHRGRRRAGADRRPAPLLGVAADGLVAGVDVGGTKVLGVLVAPDDPGTVVGEHRVPTPAGAPAVLDAIAEVVRELDAGPAAARGRRVTSGGVGIRSEERRVGKERR